LLAVLVCPACHSGLRVEPDADAPTHLVCAGDSCGLRFPVTDGIPILLVDEAGSG
jgi:hypothetical protein